MTFPIKVFLIMRDVVSVKTKYLEKTMRNNNLKIGFFLSIIIFLTNPAIAEIKSVNLHVDGLSCPFCALGLEKKLNKVDSVLTTTVHLKKAVTDLTLKPNALLNLTSIRKAVKEAGFTLKNIDIKVLGTIKRNKQNILVLESQGDKTPFILFNQEHQEGQPELPSPEMLSSDIEKKLIQAMDKKLTVSISGVIHEHVAASYGLFIDSMEISQE